MFLRYIIYIGLAVTPFVVVQGYGSRYPKEIFALVVASIIALLGLWLGRPMVIKNRWFIAFFMAAIVATITCPKISGLMLSDGGNVDGLWNYKALLHIAVYLSAFGVISNHRASNRHIMACMSIMAYSGLFMAFYIGLQAIGIDPLFKTKDGFATGYDNAIISVPSFNLFGTMGQPTLVAPFLALCVPAAWYIRKYFIVAALLLALVATKSSVALVACIGGILFFWQAHNKNILAAMAIVLGIAGALLVWKGIVTDSGRLGLWASAINDMKGNPIVFLSGYGPGAFAYIFSLKREGFAWFYLHNEYLQVLWGVGIFGFGFLVMGIMRIFVDAYGMIVDRQVRVLLTMVVIISLCAAGNFVWQLGVYCIYSVIIVGLIYGVLKNKEDCNELRSI